MAKIEPGAFKASDDVRVFDDIDDGEGEEEGSRLPLLIVIALLVLAAFGGVVWLAYNQGVQRGRADAPRPLLAETQTANPHNGIKVYEQPATPDTDTSEEDTAPPPSAVKPPSQMIQAPAKAPAQAPVVAQAPPPPAAKVEAKPQPVPPPPKAIETPTPKPAATAPAASGGDYVLQIGSYKSEAEAQAAWKGFQHKHVMLGSFSPDVKMVDLGDKGTWYRLRAGGFATKDDANAACAKLKADGGDCLLAKK